MSPPLDSESAPLPQRHLSRLRDLEKNLESYLAMGFILLYAVLVVYKILSRLLFDAYSFVWLQEVIIGLFIWAAWLSTASLVRSDDHIRFSAVIKRLPRWGVYGVYCIEWLLWLTLSGVIVQYSLRYIEQSVRSGTTITGTPIPEYLLYLSVTVGFALVFVRTCQQFVIVTRKYRAGEELLTGSDLGSE